ncbi:hypothetical protein JTE90_024773 [Oedothorax gibbosus]|uniref:YqaJ viral recombinase domain-containing protein n=1 Tax=Oedothorax gibbosus TaxID=931172 RepID=A0AAV6UAK5_9ARAC|nr:hypothetical protein JTE90_024773 [Oedothorax gibbosus]
MSDHKYYTLILIGTIFIKLVSHSQSLSDKPVQPWVIATVDGVIESAHCTSSPCKNCRKLLKSHSSKLQQRTSSLKQKLKPRVNCGTNNRAGRITTSNSKAAGITKLDAPSITTIKRICYPEKSLFHSKATSWGCNHEKDAKSQYAVQQSKTHDNFELSNAGLIINEKYPFLGSSPDGLVSCACCGLGCIELHECSGEIQRGNNSFRGSYKARCIGAGLQKFSGQRWHLSSLKALTGHSPSLTLKKVVGRRHKKNLKPRKLKYRKKNQATVDKCYAPEATVEAEPDIPEEDLVQKMKDILEELRRSCPTAKQIR